MTALAHCPSVTTPDGVGQCPQPLRVRRTLCPMDLTTQEAQHRVEAVEHLLDQMRSGGHQYDWWNRPWDELAGRTPTAALRDGDEPAVRVLIAEGYRRSEVAAERHRSDPEFVAMIERRSADRVA